MPGRWRAIGRALRHRNYRLFFTGQIISLCGTFLTQVAMVWLVYSLTNSGRILGFTAFCGQIPAFLLGPFAGVWVDRWDRRRLIVITQCLAMLQSFSLAALVFFFSGRTYIVVPGLIGLAFSQGLINAFDMPGRQAFLVEMVESREDLANAIALNSTMVHAARLIGPALAGFLIHYVGAVICFSLDGVSYIAVIAALLAMRLRPAAAKRRRRSVFHELHEGIKYVWEFTPIRSLLLLMSILSLTGMPAFSVLMPIFAKGLTGATGGGAKPLAGPGDRGAETLGLLLASSAAGALIGAIYLASRKSVVGLGRLIAIAAALFGAMLVLFTFSHHLWLSLLIVPVAGCAMLINFASSNTVMQTLTEDEKRGRVMSFFTMAFVGMTPWGNLLAGVASDAFGGGFPGAARTLQIAGGISLLAALSFALKLPVLRKIVGPIYVQRGLLPTPVATGLQTATEVVSAHEQQ